MRGLATSAQITRAPSSKHPVKLRSSPINNHADYSGKRGMKGRHEGGCYGNDKTTAVAGERPLELTVLIVPITPLSTP